MKTQAVRDLELLRLGLEVLEEAAVSGNVTIIVVDERGAVSGDLPELLRKMEEALGRVEGRLT